MRPSWIVAGVVILVAGIAAGYWLGHSGRPRDVGGGVSAPAGRAPDSPADRARVAGQPASPAAAGQGSAAAAATAAARGGVDSGDERASETSPSQELTPAERRWYAALTAPSAADASKDVRGEAPAAGGPLGSAAPPGATHGTGAARAPGGAVATVAGAAVAPPANVPPAAAAPKPDPSKVDPKAATPDDPSSDRRPPVLQSLRFDPPEVQDGGSAMLTVTAMDDLSGVKSVFGTIRSPSEAAVIPFVGQDAGGGGTFTATIAIPHKAETGFWFVGTLQIVDRANNPANVAFLKTSVPPGGALHVVSAESDSKAPTVHRVTVEKPSVGAGETNRVIVEVDDDGSGVASVTGSFQSPTKAAQVVFGCVASGDGSWVGTVAVPANADCGEWTVKYLRATDKANNAAVLSADSPELGRVGFMVSGSGGCDSEPPTLESVYVSPSVVSNQQASEVVLTFNARDEGSGVSGLTGRVEGPASTSGQVPRMFFSAQPDPKNPDAPMVVKISVAPLSAKGTWRVSVVEVTDKAHNTRAFNSSDPVLANATFTVE